MGLLRLLMRKWRVNLKKCKISFRYESEEEVSEEDIKMIKENLDGVNLEENIKDILDEYLLTDEVETDSRISDYKLEFTEWKLKR